MGIFDPIYGHDETKGLSEKERERLRNAILHELNTNKQIRGVLRDKTAKIFKELTSKKTTGK